MFLVIGQPSSVLVTELCTNQDGSGEKAGVPFEFVMFL